MKVLHVIPSVSFAHGGPSHAIRMMEKVLIAQGVQVETATTDDEGPGCRMALGATPAEDGGAIRHYFPKRTEFYKVAPAFAPWVFAHAAAYDVIHIHALFSFTSVVAAYAARRAGVPYVVRPLGVLNQYSMTQRRPGLKRLSMRFVESPILRHAAAVHFTSQEEQREAAECGVPMRGVVIPLGIEAPMATDDALVRSRFVALQGASYVLFLSRLDPKKNLEGLLRAFALCHTQWPNTQLLIAGNGAPDYVASLVALASGLGLEKRVIWAGQIEGDLKCSALAGARLFVLPSFSENFGIAAAEALMAGLPCVLGRGVAIATDVVQAGAGVAVLPEPESIAAGLRQVLAADPAGHATMSANATALAHNKFSINGMGRNLVALYEAVAAAATRPE